MTTAGRRVFVIGSPRNEASASLASAWQEHGLDARLCGAEAALTAARPGDVVLGRLDVLPTLDGVEPGLLALWQLERRGLHVLNGAAALLCTHDKLRTARALAHAGVPHPRTVALGRSATSVPIATPLVVKPRFGSWGRDVFLCETPRDVEECLATIRDRAWFRRHGGIAQEAAPRLGWDLRALVVRGHVVGAAVRRAAPGEWRTNVSLGGSSYAVDLDEDVSELARTAAAAVDAEIVGVDLLPLPDGSYLVVELNGAVEFDPTYVGAGEDVYAEVGRALRLLPSRELTGAAAR